MNTVAASPETEATPKPHKLFAYESAKADITPDYPDQAWFRYRTRNDISVNFSVVSLSDDARLQMQHRYGEASSMVSAEELRYIAATLLTAADFMDARAGRFDAREVEQP